jgi:PAS domain S-box-containing protein
MKTNTADEKLLKALNMLTCSQTRQQLRHLLQEDLDPCKGELVREHVLICGNCSDVLSDLLDQNEELGLISPSDGESRVPQLLELQVVKQGQFPENHEMRGGPPDECEGDISLIPHCNTAMFIHNGKVFLDANQMGIQLLGATTPQEVVGRRVLEFIHPDFWEIARRQGKRVKNERMPSTLVKERLLRLDGGVIDVETLALPIKYKNQQVILVIVKDITAQKKIERALQRDTARYQLIAEGSTDAIITLSPTLMILYASQAGEQLFGYERREVLRRSVVMFIHPDDLTEIEKAHAAVLDKSDIQRTCVRIRQKSGTYIWVEANIKGIREPETNRIRKIVAVARRATDYKQVERERFLEFQKAVELYKRVFDEAAFGMAIMDLETGRFLEVNPAYCEMVGYTPDELRTRTFYDITDRADIQRSREVHDALRTGQAVLQKFDKRYRHKSGIPVHGQLTTIGLCHVEGGGSALLSIVENVTQGKAVFVPAVPDNPENQVKKDKVDIFSLKQPVEATPFVDFGGFADNQEAFLIALSLAKTEKKQALQILYDLRTHIEKIHDLRSTQLLEENIHNTILALENNTQPLLRIEIEYSKPISSTSVLNER